MNFDFYSHKFADKCKVCRGKKYVSVNDKTVLCECQLRAEIEHKKEQIPADVRDKDWDDYIGEYIKNEKEIKVKNYDAGRNLSFGYCFSDFPISKLNQYYTNTSTIDETIHKHRISRSSISKRLKEGANLIILGDFFTGKTLLAALIAKEIIRASVLLDDISVKWISFNKIINSISWDKVDEELVDEISFVDFLIIDNVAAPRQKNYNTNILDGVINERMNSSLPIIMTGSSSLGSGPLIVKESMGEEFLKLMYSSNTQVIKLEIESAG